jgi:hypothetical protein
LSKPLRGVRFAHAAVAWFLILFKKIKKGIDKAVLSGIIIVNIYDKYVYQS